MLFKRNSRKDQASLDILGLRKTRRLSELAKEAFEYIHETGMSSIKVPPPPHKNLTKEDLPEIPNFIKEKESFDSM